jgi:hypothetical protein
MTTLQQYITSLNIFEKNFPSIIKKIIRDNEGKILSMVKLRLFNTGISGSGYLIGEYSELTKKIKKRKNQRASFITLRDEGDFYKGMFIELQNDSVLLDSTDLKTRDLTLRYSSSILEFTEQEQQFIINSIIEPALLKEIPDFGIINIFDED